MLSMFNTLFQSQKPIVVTRHSYESFLYDESSTLVNKAIYTGDNVHIEDVMYQSCGVDQFERQCIVSKGDFYVRRTDNSSWDSIQINIKNLHGGADLSLKMSEPEAKKYNEILGFLTASGLGFDALTMDLICSSGKSHIEKILTSKGGYALNEEPRKHIATMTTRPN